jgi:hypothetical protein
MKQDIINLVYDFGINKSYIEINLFGKTFKLFKKRIRKLK